MHRVLESTSNVLCVCAGQLTSKSKDHMVVKVADFGLSRFSKEAEENFTNCKVGPLKWMPPGTAIAFAHGLCHDSANVIMSSR